MPFKSTYQDIDIPKCNILSYFFPHDKPLATEPLWMDAADPSRYLSSAQALAWVKRLAMGYDRLGVKKGQVVMVLTPNHLFVPIAYLSAAGSGRIFTGANPSYGVDEIAFQMTKVRAAIVLVHPELLETALKASKKAGIPTNRLFLFDDVESKQQQDVVDFRRMMVSEKEAKGWQWDELAGDAATTTVACINFSSGTTGLPKGVCISHYNLVANVSQVIVNRFARTDYSPDNFPPERWLAFLPLYHAYSQMFTIGVACKLRIPVYVMRSFVFEDYLKYIQKYKINVVQVVPPVIVMLCKRSEVKNYDISSLEHVMSGAAPLSRETQLVLSDRAKCVVANGWGASEVTCGGIMMPGRVDERTGSIGWLIPNTEAMLVDDNGEEVTESEKPGELWIRGPQVMMEYWENPQATKDTITSDSWLKTGDVAMTKDDKFWIVDRKKELIKVNGLQVAPAELESVLLQHDEIADAAVTGITIHDEEVPIAYVVRQPASEIDQDQVRRFVAGKVAKYKRLAGGVKFVDEVPKLASGKIVRKQLREWAKRDAKEMQAKVPPRL